MLTNLNYILWFFTTLIVSFIGLYLLFYNKLSSLKVISKCKKISKENIKLLNISLAGKIGVGSISGIAISIIIGGKGTIFWIWLSSIILSIYTYLETKAGMIYKEHGMGGPFIYIKEKLNNKILSIIYSLLIIFTFLFSFILIQSNTIIVSFNNIFLINKYYIVIFICLIVFISINRGINSISKIVSFLVPIMGLLYIIIGLIIIINNYRILPTIFFDIFNDAFKIKSLSKLPFILGLQRAIFSNESGMGSTSMIVSLSKSSDYQQEIFFQIIGNYFISLVICTISALIIITSNYESIGITNINGIEVVNYAFYYHFGEFGQYLSLMIITLFAFSTIITSFYYGDLALKYLLKNKKSTFAKIIVIIVIVLSALINPKNIWNIVDICVSLTTLINIYSLFKLRKELKESR